MLDMIKEGGLWLNNSEVREAMQEKNETDAEHEERLGKFGWEVEASCLEERASKRCTSGRRSAKEWYRVSWRRVKTSCAGQWTRERDRESP